MRSRTFVTMSTGAALIALGVLMARADSKQSPPPPTQITTPITTPSIAPVVGPTQQSGTTRVETDELMIELALDEGVLLNGDTEADLLVSISVPEDVRTERAPVATSLVLDTSGSMDGDKIVNARLAARRLVEQLEDGDIVSVVSYASGARVIVEPQILGDDRRRIYQAIERLDARGGTCVSCGIQSGYSLLGNAPATHQRRVLLLSDGQANEGIIDTPSLGRIAEASRHAGTTTASIGLGYDYNEALMSAIAERGGASYYYVPRAEEIAAVLEREAAALSGVALTGLSVEVFPGDGVQLGQVDAVGVRRTGRTITVELPQLSAGATRRFLVPLTMDGRFEGVAAQAVGSWKPMGQDVRREELSARIARTDDAAQVTASRDATVLEVREKLVSTQLVDEALQAAAEGDSDRARAMLRSTSSRLSRNAQVADSPALEEEAEQVEALYERLGAADARAGSSALRSLRLQNAARAREVRSGRTEADEQYHADTVR